MFSKTEIIFFQVLNEELKKINSSYEIKNVRSKHYGLRYSVHTEWSLFFKNKAILHFDYILEHFLRRYIKMRDVCEMNRNIYVINEGGNWEEDFAMITSTVDLSVLDNALLEDFTYEDILDDNILQLSLFNIDKISKKIKTLNKKLKRNEKIINNRRNIHV